MDGFSEREQALEQVFAHEEEVRFRVLARRNALLAQWAAYKLGYVGDSAARYIETIADAFSEPSVGVKNSEDRVIARLVLDLTAAGWALTRKDIRKVMADFEEKAAAAVMEGRAA